MPAVLAQGGENIPDHSGESLGGEGDGAGEVHVLPAEAIVNHRQGIDLGLDRRVAGEPAEDVLQNEVVGANGHVGAVLFDGGDGKQGIGAVLGDGDVSLPAEIAVRMNHLVSLLVVLVPAGCMGEPDEMGTWGKTGGERVPSNARRCRSSGSWEAPLRVPFFLGYHVFRNVERGFARCSPHSAVRSGAGRRGAP